MSWRLALSRTSRGLGAQQVRRGACRVRRRRRARRGNERARSRSVRAAKASSAATRLSTGAARRSGRGAVPRAAVRRPPRPTRCNAPSGLSPAATARAKRSATAGNSASMAASRALMLRAERGSHGRQLRPRDRPRRGRRRRAKGWAGRSTRTERHQRRAGHGADALPTGLARSGTARRSNAFPAASRRVVSAARPPIRAIQAQRLRGRAVPVVRRSDTRSRRYGGAIRSASRSRRANGKPGDDEQEPTTCGQSEQSPAPIMRRHPRFGRLGSAAGRCAA